jgi:hypothetical protein
MSGHIGYELMRHAKPVTVGEMEKMLAPLKKAQSPQQEKHQNDNIFDEVVNHKHQSQVSQELD